MKFSVVGAGSWGTALSWLLALNSHQVWLYGRNSSLMEQMELNRENPDYLPGLKLDDNVYPTSDLGQAVSGSKMVLMVVPSHGMREAMKEVAQHISDDAIVVTASKGIEIDTLLTMSQVIQEVLPQEMSNRIVALSGPSFAKEVALKMPTAVSVAAHDLKIAEEVQHAISTGFFRVYTTTDLIGVELGGAIKNVIAIATGICDSMGLGTNTRAALITRGLAEMVRLGIAMSADPMTFSGLAGMGDLVLTCTGDLSRNRQVGLKIGQGMKIKDILSEMKMVAEGVKNAETIYKLSRKLDVPMPITEQIYLLLYEDKSPKMALVDLMNRKLKQEIWM